MPSLSARFTQSPVENKRYELDYTAQLSTGETITDITATVSSVTDKSSPPLSFVITNIALGPSPTLVAVFYASGGLDQNTYEVQFLATTSIGQIFEDIAEFNVQEKLD